MKRLLSSFLLLVCTTWGYSQDIPLSQILVPSENWTKTTSNLAGEFSAIASDSKGSLYLADTKTKSILKLDSTGKTIQNYGKTHLCDPFKRPNPF